ncbi:MAG: hypothetical protein JKY60_16215 [Kordiimonadaceae bacterium]|nr:hypothetical protein [Kordiimonadaceae bacterium]
MRFTPLVCLFVASALLASCASKKGPEKRQPLDPARAERLYRGFVERWDFDESGSVNCADITVQRTRLFNRLDTDRSQSLSSEEYRKANFEDKSFLFFPFDRIDTDTSSLVELKEFTAVSHSQFLSMDKNSDCTISKPEALLAMREKLRSERRQNGNGKRRGKGKRGGGGRRGISTD